MISLKNPNIHFLCENNHFRKFEIAFLIDAGEIFQLIAVRGFIACVFYTKIKVNGFKCVK